MKFLGKILFSRKIYIEVRIEIYEVCDTYFLTSFYLHSVWLAKWQLLPVVPQELAHPSLVIILVLAEIQGIER
jgi:hypothetical protein